MYVLIDGVDYSAYYKPKTFKATGRTGSDRTSFSLTVENPPSAPQEETEVEVWDSSLKRLRIARGRLKRVKQKVLGPDANAIILTPRFGFDLEVQGFMRDIERRSATSRQYLNKTTGFIFRDLASLVPGIDFSLVGTDGQQLQVFETRHENITQSFDRLAQIEGRQWWIDLDKKLHFEELSASPAPFAITDDTWADLAGLSLTAEPDTDNLANSVRMFYRGKYTDGQINVFNGSNQITGVNTKWLDQIVPGAKLRVNLVSNISYTVQEVRNDTLIILSSPYNEASSVSPVNYVIEDIPRATSATDGISMSLLAPITKDDGKFAAVVEPPTGYLTYQEARTYLTGVLAQRSNPVINISFKSTNTKITGRVEAGQLVTFKLSVWGMDTALQIRQLSIKDVGGETADGYPVLEYEFRFEVFLYDLATKLKKKEEPTQAAAMEPAFIEEVFSFPEVSAVQEYFSLPQAGISTTSGSGSTPAATTQTPIPQLVETPVPTETQNQYDTDWAPFVWGPSSKQWAVQSDWLTGVLTNLEAANTNILDFPIGSPSLTGSWRSGWIVQYSHNAGKSSQLVATLPAGSTALLEWRSTTNRLDPLASSNWYTDITQVPDGKFLEARVTLTRSSTSDAPSVSSLSYSPDKSILTWNRSVWNDDPVSFSADSGSFSSWTFDAATVNGSGLIINSSDTNRHPQVLNTPTTGTVNGVAGLSMVAGSGPVIIPSANFLDNSPTPSGIFMLTEAGDRLVTEDGLSMQVTDLYDVAILMLINYSAVQQAAGTYMLFSLGGDGEIAQANTLRLFKGNDGKLHARFDGTFSVVDASYDLTGTPTGLGWVGLRLNAKELSLWVNRVELSAVVTPDEPISMPTYGTIGADASNANQWGDLIAKVVILAGQVTDAEMAAQMPADYSMPAWLDRTTMQLDLGTGSFDYINPGTAVGPWLSITVRTVAKLVQLNASLAPYGAKYKVQFRTSADGTEQSASAWYDDIRDTPDAGYIQPRIVVTGSVNNPVQVHDLTISQ